LQLSKTAQLGVIVLGLEHLRQVGIAAPRVVAQAAARLGVSRKAGYEAAERLRQELSEKEDVPTRGGCEREIALLRIRVQALSYERDHREVRFSERSRHLPQEARSFCVRLLRDFRAQLSDEEIAGTIGVASSSLRRWDCEADEHGRFPPKRDERGKRRHHREEDEPRVVELFRALQEPATLTDFAARYNAAHPDRPLDPKTITRILRKHGLVSVEARERSAPFRDKVRIYFPGAQAAVDATECQVRFRGAGGEETIKFDEEVAIDLATSAILGTALRREEDSEGVRRVVVRARRECENLLAVLQDNGSANRSSEVQRVVASETDVGAIFSFPEHPQTNGHIEGLFGSFKRIVGDLEVDDTSRATAARSVVAIAWRIFSHFHNHSPRQRLGGISPIGYLRRYAALPEEVERARGDLRERKERSERLRREPLRLEEASFQELVERVVSEHGFDVDLARARRALLRYDDAVIESASRAFLVASCRNGFEKEKRTFAYFHGILRRKQKEVDEARGRDRFDRERARQRSDEERRYARQIQREDEEERAALREEPERVVLQAAEFLLAGGLELLRKRGVAKLRTALRAMGDLGRNTPRRVERCAREIRGWPRWSEDLKRRMVELLEEEAAADRQRHRSCSTSRASAATESTL
jgi:transposase